jgi:hypothetical protein
VRVLDGEVVDRARGQLPVILLFWFAAGGAMQLERPGFLSLFFRRVFALWKEFGQSVESRKRSVKLRRLIGITSARMTNGGFCRAEFPLGRLSGDMLVPV